MAIDANHVALRDFFEDRCATLQGGSSRAEREALLFWIAVVEIHHVPGEAASTVGARHLSQRSKELDSCLLATANSLDLTVAVGGVVPDVGRSLVAHGSL